MPSFRTTLGSRLSDSSNSSSSSRPLLLAPIAGYCDLSFRLTIRPLGGLALAYTDLVNPRGLLRQTVKSMELIDTEPADRPLAVQLYGHEPGMMADAARWCADHLELAAIDINMGCPVDKVTKKNGGAALLKTPELAVRLAESVVRAVDLPVTAKMRLGWNAGSLVAPQLAAKLEEVGIAAITVHGRTADQLFRGRADWDGIARVVEAVRRVPIVGNGDINLLQDAARMMQQTGCAGVMIGRGALSNPWLFRDTQTYLVTGEIPPPASLEERIAFVRTHFEHHLRIRGERRACISFRQRITWYSRMLGAGASRDWCEQFRHLSSASHFYELMSAIEDRHEVETKDHPVAITNGV